MILVFIAIGLAFIIWGLCIDDYDFTEILTCIGTIIFCVALITTLILGIIASNLKTLDSKIAMYQEENEKIEAQIDAAVKQYQEYESGVFADAKAESSITLVSLYPELKSDTMVQQQIEVYLKNNETIKNLKRKQINGTVVRWWLYFGK